MGLLKKIRTMLLGSKFARLSQAQTEAVVDTLTLAMVADGEVSQREETEMAKTLDEMDWEGDFPIDVYVDDAVEHAHKLLEEGKEAIGEYLDEISERLEDQPLREEVYYLSARIAFADDSTVKESERVFLNQLVTAFEIDRDRLNLMVENLMKEM